MMPLIMGLQERKLGAKSVLLFYAWVWDPHLVPSFEVLNPHE